MSKAKLTEKNKNRIKDLCVKTASLMLIMIMTMMPLIAPALSDAAYAASEGETAYPLREVHMVRVGQKMYCFFVQRTVVLTPEKVAGLDDNELVAEILTRSGLYMKETNCKKSSARIITVSEWIKNGGSFLLDIADIDSIRQAAPSEGEPVKLYMDLKISTEQVSASDPDKTDDENGKTDDNDKNGGSDKDSKTDSKDGTDKYGKTDSQDGSDKDGDADTDGGQSGGDGEAAGGEADDQKDGTADEPKDDAADEKDDPDDDPAKDIPIYTTRKMIGAELFLVEIATENDAKQMEDICRTEQKSTGTTVRETITAPDMSDIDDKEKEELLPEFRTINMVDRSGPRIKPTLQDGSPVTLEWIEPQRQVVDTGKFDRVPGGLAGLIILTAVTAAAVAFAIYRVRKSRAA